MTSTPTPLDLGGPLPRGRVVVEASAGTGKTYSLSALVARHIAERSDLTAANLLVVTFTRAAAAELRDRTRRALVEARDALSAGASPKGEPWIEALLADPAKRPQYLERLSAAVTSFDDATITTIHGFCQQALRQLGLRSGAALGGDLGQSTGLLVDEVCRDLLVRTLYANPTALTPVGGDKVSTILTHLIGAVKVRLANPTAIVIPTLVGTDSMPAHEPHKPAEAGAFAAWLALVDEAVAEVSERSTANGEMSFDGLIAGLRSALQGPDGPTVAGALQQRYGLVMVDEFQDTDQMQWDIFGAAFTGDLVTVGDPKQAIYRFRGADVHAYLSAVADEPAFHLGTNYRSDADLIAATNAVLEGIELGDPRVTALPVAPSVSKPVRALRGVGNEPFEVRWTERDESLLGPPTKKQERNVVSGKLQSAICADLVNYVVDLLGSGRLHLDPDSPDTSRALKPGDIAVLVKSHSQAESIVFALGQGGIPAVRSKTGNVFASPAMNEWRLLLAALERPADIASVRAAGLGVFLRHTPDSLDPLAEGSEATIARLQQTVASWAQLLAERPFLAWYDEVRADHEMVVTVLGHSDGERLLTDLDHIAELVAARVGATRINPSGLRRLLVELASEVDESDGTSPQMRRIDSDDDAVQVTTLHGSKGLQYPVVLVPFAWTKVEGTKEVFNLEDGARIVDIASSYKWKSPDSQDFHVNARDHWAKASARGDALRLLYVGLTRGEHRTVVWWGPHPDSQTSALNVVLFDRDDTGVPNRHDITPEKGTRGGVTVRVPKVAVQPHEVAARMEALEALSPGNIATHRVDLPVSADHWDGDRSTTDLPALGVAERNGRVVSRAGWQRWSFSAIKAERDGHGVHDLHRPDDIVPVAGGADEGDEPDDASLGDPVLATPTPLTPSASSVPMPWAEIGGGTAFGTFVHEVMERLDPQSPTLDADVKSTVGHLLFRHRLDLAPAQVTAGVMAALHTPLGPLFDGLSLAQIGAADRLAELDFELTLCGGEGSLPATAIGEVLLATLEADDPMRGYAEQLAAGRFDVDVAGYLRGSIDAVFRIPDAQCGHRYLVVDYKTNRLHGRHDADPLAAYRPAVLPQEMAHTDYALQALLYSVAVHRYLRWRQPGYRPDAHLGGIGYLFMRGMVGPSTPVEEGVSYGVFSWRPPAAAVVALDELLATGRVTGQVTGRGAA